MKWAGAYFIGYVLLILGLVAALVKTGVLAGVSPAWIAIGAIVLLGVGVMISITNSGRKESISIEK
jgi:hypothetical protein